MKRKSILLGVGALIIVGGVTLTAATGGPVRAARQAGQGTERDVSRPNETRTDMVWRNGKYHKVLVPILRYRVTGPDGRVGERIVVGGKPGTSGVREAVEAQLPPRDPALDGAQPSPTDQAEADRELAIDRPLPPPQDSRP